MVWHSHLFENFPQSIVIHTVKGFGIVNKTEIDVFLELSCFFDDPADVGDLISGSSAFSQLYTQLHPILCDPMVCRLPGSSVHGISQARILEWVAISFSRDLPHPGTDLSTLESPALASGFFTTSATLEEETKQIKAKSSRSLHCEHQE